MTTHLVGLRSRAAWWTPGIVGGLLSIPLSIGLYWATGMGSSFSANMVVIGGFIAGYLASQQTAAVGKAGVLAGVIGGLPIYAWILPGLRGTARDFAVAWSAPIVESVFVAVFSVIVFAIPILAGLVGAVLGTGVDRVLKRRQSSVRQ